MSERRIIPCLDIKDGKVVKGVNFVGLSDIGDPVEIAKRYEQQGADEIAILSIDGSRLKLPTLSIPITFGGGIRTMDDIKRARDDGATKVSIGSAAVADQELIREADVIAIDARAREETHSESGVPHLMPTRAGGSDVYINGWKTNTGIDLIEWVKKCEALGAKEILLTSMDGDGTQNGYDIPMTKTVCDAVSIPVIASGGCGKIEDIIEVFRETGCDAALVASLFHYGKATIEMVRSQFVSLS